MSIINTSPRAAHTSDTGFGGNEAHRSVEAFHDAKNIDARGAQFNHVGHDQINYHGTTASILETLGPHRIPGATYDSLQREHSPICVTNTHMDVMKKICDWVDENDGRPMCLLTGPAGLGKSTIAQTLAKSCAGDNKLAASIFFSRSIPQCSGISKVILTLAYQLAVAIPAMQEPIKAAFKADPSIPDKNLEIQFTKLVYEPIFAIGHPFSLTIIIIDALDECEDKDGVVKLIKIITGTIQAERTFPLCFFFTSRLEEHIASVFSEPMAMLKTNRLALEDFIQDDESEEEKIARLSPRQSLG